MISRKYAEDYGLENVLDERGGLKTTAVYKGVWYGFAAPPEVLLWTRRVYASGTVLCAAALAIPLLINTDLMRAAWVSIPLALGLWPVLHLLMGLYRLMTAKERVTREHRDKLHDRFALWSLVLTGLCLLSLVGQAAWYLRGMGQWRDVGVTLCTLICAGMAVTLFVCKKNLRMVELEETDGKA